MSRRGVTSAIVCARAGRIDGDSGRRTSGIELERVIRCDGLQCQTCSGERRRLHDNHQRACQYGLQRQQRDQWLAMPRLHLGLLKGLSGEWSRLRPWLLDDDQIVILQELESELSPKLRARVEATSSTRILQRALRTLHESLQAFNRRWLDFLRAVDLTPVNEARGGYNRYYLLEKECAVRSGRLARQGFMRLEPFTMDELMKTLPDLPIPKHIELI